MSGYRPPGSARARAASSSARRARASRPSRTVAGMRTPGASSRIVHRLSRDSVATLRGSRSTGVGHAAVSDESRSRTGRLSSDSATPTMARSCSGTRGGRGWPGRRYSRSSEMLAPSSRNCRGMFAMKSPATTNIRTRSAGAVAGGIDCRYTCSMSRASCWSARPSSCFRSTRRIAARSMRAAASSRSVSARSVRLVISGSMSRPWNAMSMMRVWPTSVGGQGSEREEADVGTDGRGRSVTGWFLRSEWNRARRRHAPAWRRRAGRDPRSSCGD